MDNNKRQAQSEFDKLQPSSQEHLLNWFLAGPSRDALIDMLQRLDQNNLHHMFKAILDGMSPEEREALR